MAIDEQIRHDLFTGLQAALGLEPAKLMMTAIPPFSWHEIATKADLTKVAARDEMSAEFAAVRNEMKSEFAAVRNEMKSEFAAVRGEMKSEFAAVRGEMHAASAAIRDEMHTDSASIRLELANSTNRTIAQIARIQWNLFFQIAMFNISTAGIVLAALHYLR
jgi:hypothetical protein